MFERNARNHAWLRIAMSFVAGVVLTMAATSIFKHTDRSDAVALAGVHDEELAGRLLGQWDVNDPRILDVSKSMLSFHPDGRLERDSNFNERWFCRDGVIYIISSRVDDAGGQDEKDHLVPLVPEFDETTGSLLLTSAWGDPRLLLTRPNAA